MNRARTRIPTRILQTTLLLTATRITTTRILAARATTTKLELLYAGRIVNLCDCSWV